MGHKRSQIRERLSDTAARRVQTLNEEKRDFILGERC